RRTIDALSPGKFLRRARNGGSRCDPDVRRSALVYGVRSGRGAGHRLLPGVFATCPPLSLLVRNVPFASTDEPVDAAFRAETAADEARSGGERQAVVLLQVHAEVVNELGALLLCRGPRRELVGRHVAVPPAVGRAARSTPRPSAAAGACIGEAGRARAAAARRSRSGRSSPRRRSSSSGGRCAP